MNFKLTNVGIADIGVAESPDVLRTILGSCIGVCLYDPESKKGGLCHIMLPAQRSNTSSPKKYADTAIPMLIEELEKIGAQTGKLVAKIAGGATMFKLSENSIMADIGRNNSNKVKEILTERNIKLLAEDVGGDYGRTIDFFIETGEVKIKSIGKSDIII
ncbi:MAG: chemotaxis protein CheD [bacterium]|nr:chemotaxis protein CheD [bacterium]